MNSFIAILLSIVSCNARTGQAPSTYWINPPASGLAGFYTEDTVFQVSNNVQLQWATNETFYSIFLFQQQSASYAALGDPIYSKTVLFAGTSPGFYSGWSCQ